MFDGNNTHGRSRATMAARGRFSHPRRKAKAPATSPSHPIGEHRLHTRGRCRASVARSWRRLENVRRYSGKTSRGFGSVSIRNCFMPSIPPPARSTSAVMVAIISRAHRIFQRQPVSCAMPDHAGNVVLASDGGLFGSRTAARASASCAIVESAERDRIRQMRRRDNRIVRFI